LKLEPYEGKLSRAILRRERRGNPPDPADDDAFLALTVVEDSTLYQVTEKTIPHDKKYRVSGFPKDAFHIPCIAHKTRLQNILRSPGIDSIEKALLKQRFANLAAAQSGYIAKQRKALMI
jgi:hypothetical protein